MQFFRLSRMSSGSIAVLIRSSLSLCFSLFSTLSILLRTVHPTPLFARHTESFVMVCRHWLDSGDTIPGSRRYIHTKLVYKFMRESSSYYLQGTKGTHSIPSRALLLQTRCSVMLLHDEEWLAWIYRSLKLKPNFRVIIQIIWERKLPCCWLDDCHNTTFSPTWNPEMRCDK